MTKLLLGVAVLLSLNLVRAQSFYQLQLNHFPYTPAEVMESAPDAGETVSGYFYRLIQFQRLLSAEEKQQLTDAGVIIHYYLHPNAYLAALPVAISTDMLRLLPVRSMMAIPADMKISDWARMEPVPGYALKPQGRVGFQVKVFPEISWDNALQLLNKHGVLLVPHPTSGVIEMAFPPEDLDKIASLPFVQYIDLIDEPGMPENEVGRALHRSNAIFQEFAGGLPYDGTGVQVQMQDDGGIGPHLDYQGRIGAQFSNNFNPSDNHGDHVAGTIMSAGNLDPQGRGMAPGATLWVYNYGQFNDSIVAHYAKYGIRITSSSYSNGCNRGYTAVTVDHDQETRLYPELIHVFSAGNSNGQNCGYGAGGQWGNITGGHKVGKNVLAVANVDRFDNIAGSSSRGPAHDGRIKPEVAAQGTAVYSTIPPYDYDNFTGTSMACPGVSGSLAQLYHAYNDLYGSNPPSALIKAAMMNTADDKGNPGPDFIYGFGRINNLKAYQLLAAGNWFTDTIDQSQSRQFTLTVPAGVQQVKVMLYWHDFEAAAGASRALVNNLDMVIEDGNGAILLPLVLDATPDPVALNQPAVPGIDSLNNVEQIVLDQPAAGNYAITINGTAVPVGSQRFYVVYEFITDDITVTYPSGGELVRPNLGSAVHWDAYGTQDTFRIELSRDNGQSWLLLGQAPGSSRQFAWNVPLQMQGKALIRVSRNGAQDVSDAPFYILGVPERLGIDTACCDYYSLSWDNVPAADAYIVYSLGTKYMEPIDTVTTTFYRIPVPVDSTWYSVAAWQQGDIISQRARAIAAEPGLSFNCSRPGNLILESVASPSKGVLTACRDEISIVVTVANTDAADAINVPVTYLLNGVSVTETIDTIKAASTVTYTFSQTLTPVSGNNDFAVYVAAPGDPNACDDSTKFAFTTRSGQLVTLPHLQDFEGIATCSIDPDCGATVCSLNKGWLNEENGFNDDIDWRVDNGGTFSSGTGPSADYRPGNAFGRYVYTEASGNCTGQTASLVSPCIDLAGAQQPTLSFYYHMLGANMGTMQVDVLTRNGWVNNLFSRSGNQGGQWQRAEVDLSAYIDDTIAIRFIGITGNDFASDMALDFIYIYENTPLQADFQATDTACANDIVVFTDQSNSIDLSYSWNFGQGANPAGASTKGPHNVVYATSGTRQVSLVVTRGTDADTLTNDITIVDDTKADFTAVGNGFTYTFSDQSVQATSWHWDFGDGDTSNVASPVHTFSDTGAYTVVLTVNGSCGTDSKSASYLVYGVGIQDVATLTTTLQPNPAKDHSVLLLTGSSAGGQLQVTDMQGRLIWSTFIPTFEGTHQVVIQTSDWPSGVYVASTLLEEGKHHHSLVIQQ